MLPVQAKKIGTDLFFYNLKYNKTEDALALLKAGEVEINDWDINGVTALHLSVLCKNVEYVKMLLEYGGDPDLHDNVDIGYWTPLHRAAEQGSIPMLKELLAGGANINARNKLGQTALHIAVRSRNVEMSKFLISQEADMEIRDIMSWNPSYYAKREGLVDLTEIMPAALSLEAVHVYDNQKFIQMVLP